MSFWHRLFGKSPDMRQPATSPSRMLPLAEFRQLVEKSAGSVLASHGWKQHDGRLEWDRECRSWAKAFLEFPILKGGGVTIRWGLRLSFMPALGGRPARFGDRIERRRAPDFSYEPTDYEKSAGQWTLSRFSTEEEIIELSKIIAERGGNAAADLCTLCIDAATLTGCFEEKRSKKHVRFGFYDYPQEVLAYAVVLGLAGRKTEGLKELDRAMKIAAIPPTKVENFRSTVLEIWEEIKLSSQS
jgi:hypothetical protein